MIFNVILKLALRDIHRHTARSLLAGLPIALGAAVIVLNSGLVTGTSRQLVDNLLIGQSGHVQIRAGQIQDALPESEFGSSGRIEHPQEVTALITSLLPEAEISSSYSSLGMVLGEGTSSSRVVLQGVADGPGSGMIDLGERLAEQLRASQGSLVTVTLPNGRGDLNSTDFEVAAVLAPGAPWQDYFAYIALGELQELVEAGGAVQEIRIHLSARGPSASEAAARLDAGLQEAGYDLEVLTYRESGRFFMGIVTTARIQMGLMNLVLLIAVGLTVGGTQLLVVHARRRDIGTMMALGMPRALVSSLFLLEGIFAALLFGTLGAAIGFAVTGALAQIGLPLPSEGFRWMVGGSRIFPVATLGAAGKTLCGLIVAAAAGGLYPALGASRLDPAKTIGEMPQ
jgi:putative ABC transport system permease protein